MALEQTIAEVTGRLRQGKFPNEQSISQGIVLRIFQELGWDTWDTTVVWPEYQTGGGRADFALCCPPSKPAIFTEVKQPGKAEDAVKQALEYAFHSGVPFIVLTDGRTWSFYLPAEQGDYEDRRVYKLDLYERPVEEAAEIFRRYLERGRVESGQALEDARNEYRSRNRRMQAKNAIEEVWRDMLEKRDEQLVELVRSAVENKIGVRPELEDVNEFLSRLDIGHTNFILGEPSPRKLQVEDSEIALSRPSGSHPRKARRKQQVEDSEVAPLSRSGAFIFMGKEYNYNNAKEAMVLILTMLANNDASFLQRCSQHPDFQGRKRSYVARTPKELYPDRPELRSEREALPGGWFVGTNLNNAVKMKIIKAACEVAGIEFGKDLVIDFE